MPRKTEFSIGTQRQQYPLREVAHMLTSLPSSYVSTLPRSMVFHDHGPLPVCSMASPCCERIHTGRDQGLPGLLSALNRVQVSVAESSRPKEVLEDRYVVGSRHLALGSCLLGMHLMCCWRKGSVAVSGERAMVGGRQVVIAAIC